MSSLMMPIVRKLETIYQQIYKILDNDEQFIEYTLSEYSDKNYKYYALCDEFGWIWLECKIKNN